MAVQTDAGPIDERLICSSCGEFGKINESNGQFLVSARCYGDSEFHCQTMGCRSRDQAISRWERMWCDPDAADRVTT